MAHETNSISDCGLEKQYNHLKINGDPKVNESISENPRNLVSELCNHFYYQGWASGMNINAKLSY